MRMQIVVGLTGLLTASAVYTGCTSSEKSPSDTTATAQGEQEKISRELAAAGVGMNKAYLVFYSTKARRDNSGQERVFDEKVEVVTPVRWRSFEKQSSTRRQLMLDFYFANTREKSDSGRRNVACFIGAAEEVKKEFFDDVTIDDFQNMKLTPSTDNLMIGVNFKIMRSGKLVPAHFRIPSCTHTGKNVTIDMSLLNAAVRKQEQRDSRGSREPGAAKDKQASAEKDQLDLFDPKQGDAALARVPAAIDSEGYVVNDHLPPGESRLPRFVLKADYNNAPANEPMPWRDPTLDLRKEEDAMKLAQILKKYLYEKMADQNKDPNFNLDPRKANKYWCHMPWLNQGPDGREAVHGLTQEKSLKPSGMYPNATPGTNWGIAVFNFAGCRAIGRVFGPASSPSRLPQSQAEWQAKTNFDDGTVIGKFLFTQANFPDLQGAWQVVANVNPPNSTARSLQPVRHIQLDIGVKDSFLNRNKIPIKNADDWLMVSYYYDIEYDDGFDISDRMPKQIRKMRPLGIQWGFTPADSLIFKGTKTNSVRGDLNGPADNPKSNCMACHGTAGNDVAMAPGIQTTQHYFQLKKEGRTLDMGQQFAFARRYYETRAQESAR